MKRLNKFHAILGALPVLALTSGAALAQNPGNGLGSLFSSVTSNFGLAVPMIMILAFIGGIFFAVSAMLKMKDAKENPRDNSAGTIALNWVAAIFLIFLGGGIMMMQTTLGVGEGTLTGRQTVTYGGN